MAFAFSWLFFSKDHPSKNIEDRNTSHSVNMRTSWLLSTTEMSSTIWGGKICFSYPQILQICCDPHHSPPFVSLKVVKTSKVPGQLGRGGNRGHYIYQPKQCHYLSGKSLKFTIHLKIKFDPPPPTGPMKSFLGKAGEIPTLGRFRKPKALCRMRWAPLRIITPWQFRCFPWGYDGRRISCHDF